MICSKCKKDGGATELFVNKFGKQCKTCHDCRDHVQKSKEKHKNLYKKNDFSFSVQQGQTKKQTMENDDDVNTPRSPDFAFQDQLLTTHGTYDPDEEELRNIIEQSRHEYMEQEQRRLLREQEKTHLQQCLAIPISRLKLWKQTTSNQQEKKCLHHVLNILYLKTHPDRDDDDIDVPVHCRQEVREFLETHLKPSPLFQKAYELCDQCLSGL